MRTIVLKGTISEVIKQLHELAENSNSNNIIAK